MRFEVKAVFLMMMVLGSFSVGCKSTDSRIDLFMTAEDSITEGLSAGTGADQIVDGWNAEYSRFIISINKIRLQTSATDSQSFGPGWRSSEEFEQDKNGATLLDLRKIPTLGVNIYSDVIPYGRYSAVGYDIKHASVASFNSISDADAAEIGKASISLWVSGTLSKADGQSCIQEATGKVCKPANLIRFDWPLDVGTRFKQCGAKEGAKGVVTVLGGTSTAKVTIHGDHWFFTNFGHDEDKIQRRAQWIANCDLNRDGVVTIAELKQVKFSDVFDASLYSTEGASLAAGASIQTAYDYLVAQTRSLGHFDNDGECEEKEVLY